jgi:hypothetical protein
MAVAGNAPVDEERIRRIEDLVRRMEAIPDPASRETAQALMEAILDLHGAAMERMMEIVFDAGESGKGLVRRLAGDSIVASLLVLHGLHPDDIETRVQHALGKMHGSAELLGVFEGCVRVRLTASGCGMRDAVAAAIREAAPDATEILIEESAPSGGFVPLASLGSAVPERM